MFAHKKMTDEEPREFEACGATPKETSAVSGDAQPTPLEQEIDAHLGALSVESATTSVVANNFRNALLEARRKARENPALARYICELIFGRPRSF